MEIRSFEIGFKLASDQCLAAILKRRIAESISTKPIANDQSEKDVIRIGHSVVTQVCINLGLMLDLIAVQRHFRSD